MRKIKFRGKKTDSKTWVYGFYFFSQDYGTHFIKDSRKFENSNEYVDYDVEVDGDSVGQLSDFYDSKGIEIYEGDILTNDTHWGLDLIDIRNIIFNINIFLTKLMKHFVIVALLKIHSDLVSGLKKKLEIIATS